PVLPGQCQTFLAEIYGTTYIDIGIEPRQIVIYLDFLLFGQFFRCQYLFQRIQRLPVHKCRCPNQNKTQQKKIYLSSALIYMSFHHEYSKIYRLLWVISQNKGKAFIANKNPLLGVRSSMRRL